MEALSAFLDDVTGGGESVRSKLAAEGDLFAAGPPAPRSIPSQPPNILDNAESVRRGVLRSSA
jgi:hypothetical protein